MAKSEIRIRVAPTCRLLAKSVAKVRLHDCTVHRMTQTKPAPSSGESRLKRYFGNPNRLKTHARCWTHVIVFSVELVTTRNPMVLFHFGCNVAWQFCTLSPAIERAGYLGDACNRVVGICPRNCTGHGACDERTATCVRDPVSNRSWPV